MAPPLPPRARAPLAAAQDPPAESVATGCQVVGGVLQRVAAGCGRLWEECCGGLRQFVMGCGRLWQVVGQEPPAESVAAAAVPQHTPQGITLLLLVRRVAAGYGGGYGIIAMTVVV